MLLAEDNKIHDLSRLNKWEFIFLIRSKVKKQMVVGVGLSNSSMMSMFMSPEILFTFPSWTQNSYRNSIYHAQESRQEEGGRRRGVSSSSSPQHTISMSNPMRMSHWLGLCMAPHLAAREAGKLGVELGTLWSRTQSRFY